MLRTATLAVIALLLPAIGKSQVSIPIQNPSFEQAPTLSWKQDQCGPWISQVPNWKITVLSPGNGAGIFQPANVTIPNHCEIPQPMPDGITVAYLGGASISQDLGTVSGTGIYTLKFFVANRFYYYPAAYLASLTLTDWEGTHIYSISGYATGDFVQVPLVCIRENPKPANLNIAFTGNGTFMLLLDKVSLDFTPSN